MIELRRQIDGEAEHERFLAKRLAATAGAKLMFAPPYVGKFWAPVELLWSSTKRAYRGLPEAARKNENQAIEAIKTLLKEFERKDQSLINMCLPGFRFSFAVLSALYHRNVVEYKCQRVLFPALEQSILGEGNILRSRAEFPLPPNGVCEDPFEGEGEDFNVNVAPAGMSTHRFPTTILHRDRSLRQFRLVQVQDRILVVVPDVAAAPPPPEPLESVAALDDEVERPIALDDAAVSEEGPSNFAVAVRFRPHMRVTKKRPRPIVVTPMTACMRLTQIRKTLRRSSVRCTCGTPIHQDTCNLWTTEFPRVLRTPGEDVGLSKEDYKFFESHRSSGKRSSGPPAWGHRGPW